MKMEEERVRVKENLANWLLQNINKGCGFKDMTFGQAATQILNQEGIRIEADDQSLPDIEGIFADAMGLEKSKHKNVLGDKWKYITPVVKSFQGFVKVLPEKE